MVDVSREDAHVVGWSRVVVQAEYVGENEPVLIGREGGLVNWLSRLGDDRAFWHAYGVDADTFVPAWRPDDVAVKGESIDAGGGAQKVGDARRVVLTVFAGQGRQEATERSCVRPGEVGEACVVSRIPPVADVGREQGTHVAVVEPVHRPIKALACGFVVSCVLEGVLLCCWFGRNRGVVCGRCRLVGAVDDRGWDPVLLVDCDLRESAE